MFHLCGKGRVLYGTAQTGCIHNTLLVPMEILVIPIEVVFPRLGACSITTYHGQNTLILGHNQRLAVSVAILDTHIFIYGILHEEYNNKGVPGGPA